MVARLKVLALSAGGLSLALLISGCAWWDRSAGASLAAWSAPPDATAPALQSPAPPPALPRPPLPVSEQPEDFLCLDGSWLRVSSSGSRDTISVSLDGSAPIVMHREDEAGLLAYRAAGLVLRRSGVRVALAAEAASVTVQSGDTLGLIALRAYGDRTRALEIARLNGIENPDLILPGQVLSLPRLEQRCRRTLHQEASYTAGGGAVADRNRTLDRRLFSPPSHRQPDQQNVRATATDPSRH